MTSKTSSVIRPFGRNVLVEPAEVQGILRGPEGTLCEYGTVVAVGKGCLRIKVGDKIGYTVFGVNRLEYEGKKYYFIPEDDSFILGIITV